MYGKGSYEITLPDVVWQWDDQDVMELGYTYMVDGYKETDPIRQREWKEAREFTKEFRPKELPTLYLVTNFVRGASGEGVEWGGLYYCEDRTICLFWNWDVVKKVILHEYCHYLTWGSNRMIEEDPEDIFSEWIAVWLADIELGDEMSEQEAEAVLKSAGIRAEGREFEDEKGRKRIAKVIDYMETIINYRLHQFEDKDRAPVKEKGISYPVKMPQKYKDLEGFKRAYRTYGCLAKYTYEKYGLDKLIELGRSNIDCEKVLGISFDRLYFDMIEWVKPQIPEVLQEFFEETLQWEKEHEKQRN
ncbi:hypothetical protein SAMN02910358_01007 [Lachnospiraceae bacterium XBB1006]|nr:hypothetical protein SAMN02910358_01007 [Lachnospiraceae bacterium XBB1006]